MKKNNQLGQAEILILESDNTSVESLSIALPDHLHNFKKVGSSEEILKALDLQDYAVILLNAGKNWQHVTDTIRMIKQKSTESMIIVLAAP